jgi:hypothetical protein
LRTQAENDDLKNILTGLELKLNVHNDVLIDLEQCKTQLELTEQARIELQNHTEQTAIKIQEDAKQHKVFNEMLCKEISNLKDAATDQEQQTKITA